jgi:hypothetical protein
MRFFFAVFQPREVSLKLQSVRLSVIQASSFAHHDPSCHHAIGHPHDAIRRVHCRFLGRLQPDEHQLRDSGYAAVMLATARSQYR